MIEPLQTHTQEHSTTHTQPGSSLLSRYQTQAGVLNHQPVLQLPALVNTQCPGGRS
jgi:hypothetical protein